MGPNPWGHKELDTIEQLTHTHEESEKKRKNSGCQRLEGSRRICEAHRIFRAEKLFYSVHVMVITHVYVCRSP